MTMAASATPAWIEEMPWGQPIDDPPPIVEPLEASVSAASEKTATADLEIAAPAVMPSGRPTRRLFLAPSARDLAAAAPRPPPAPAPAGPPPSGRVEIVERAMAMPAAPRAEDPAAPWWREPPSEPPWAALDESLRPDQHQAAFEPPLPLANTSQEAPAASAFDRWRAAGRAARAWWPHQKRPIVVAVAVVAILVVAAGVAGIGPLERLAHEAAAPPPPPPPPAPVAEVQKLPAVPDDPVARVPFYLDRAKAGDAESQLELAILYAKGEGLTPDYTQAATWFRAAAEQGVARAQYDLGVLYERGRGVPVDYGEAFSWYSRAADGNFALAQYNLAVAYTRGQGTRQDFVAAGGWYHRAAMQGVVPAMVNLAILYERGEGVNASAIDAYAWYRAAASRGNQPSAKRAAELLDVLSATDRRQAEARAATVLAAIPAPAPGEVPAAASGSPAALKSGIEPDASEGGKAKPAAAAH